MLFWGRIILKHIEIKKKGFRVVRRHAPRKVFKNLHTAVAILALFDQFLGKFC